MPVVSPYYPKSHYDPTCQPISTSSSPGACYLCHSDTIPSIRPSITFKLSVYTPVISYLDYAPYLFCLGLCTLKLLFGFFIHPHFILGLPPVILFGFFTHPPLSFGFYHPLFHLGFPPVIIWVYTPTILFDYTPVFPYWVYTPVIFHLGLRTLHLAFGSHALFLLLFGFTTCYFYLGLPLAFFLHILILYPGLRTRYFLFGLNTRLGFYEPIIIYLGLRTHYLLFRVYAPYAFSFIFPHFAVWAYTPSIPLGFFPPAFYSGSPPVIIWVGAPLIFIWILAPIVFHTQAFALTTLYLVYVPIIFYLGLRTLHLAFGLHTLFLFGFATTCYFIWDYHSPFLHALILYLGLRTRYFLSGLTHPLYSVWVFTNPLSFIWVYAPVIFYFGLMHPMPFQLCTLTLPFGFFHPPSFRITTHHYLGWHTP